jgi:hypothetical protein
MNVTWGQTPSAVVNVTTGETRGTIASWYVPNLTAGTSTIRNFTVVGDWDVSGLFTTGLRANGVNTTNVLAP